MSCGARVVAVLSLVTLYLLYSVLGLTPAVGAPVLTLHRNSRWRHQLGQAGTSTAGQHEKYRAVTGLPHQLNVQQSAQGHQRKPFTSPGPHPTKQVQDSRLDWQRAPKVPSLLQRAKLLASARSMHPWLFGALTERNRHTIILRKRLRRLNSKTHLPTSLAHLESAGTAPVSPVVSSSNAAGGHDTSAASSNKRDEFLTGTGSSSDSSTSGRSIVIERGPPESCQGTQYKLAQLDVVMHRIPVDYDKLCDQVSLAIAKQLQLKNSEGAIDATRVETYLWDTHTADDLLGSIKLQVYVWLSGKGCNVFTSMWLQLVEDEPSSIFSKDSGLQDLVLDVKAVYSDPGVYIKNRIKNSNNMVMSVSVGSQVLNSTGADDTDSDLNTDAGIYDWFFTSGSAAPKTIDGMLIMGIISGSLLMLLILVVLIQRHLQHRAAHRAAATATAAALAVLTAEPAAEPDASNRSAVQPAAQASAEIPGSRMVPPSTGRSNREFTHR